MINFSLNFVWINTVRQPICLKESGVTCPIPTLYQDNITSIAEDLPDVPITVWADICGPGHNDVKIIEAMGATSNIRGVTFRSLDSVPAYLTNPLFTKTSKNAFDPVDPIWQQVDIARLLVIDYALIGEGYDAAIYSDMNRLITPDIIEQSVERLNKHGVVVGDGWQSEPNFKANFGAKYRDNFQVENQFVGMSKNRLDFLRDEVFRLSARGVKYGSNGWEGFVDAFMLESLRGYKMGINAIGITVPKMQHAATAKAQYTQSAVIPKSVQSGHQQP